MTTDAYQDAVTKLMNYLFLIDAFTMGMLVRGIQTWMPNCADPHKLANLIIEGLQLYNNAEHDDE